MKLYKYKLIKKKYVKSVYCNKCGIKIKKDYLEIKKRWGFFSSFDNEVHSFHICENCYLKFINSFKIKVAKHN